MGDSAQQLFVLFDDQLDSFAKAISNRVFSEYRGMSWSPEQRRVLQPLVRGELNRLVYAMLGLFNNVGGVLPDGIHGWSICSSEDDQDISDGYAVYSDMWMEYLLRQDPAAFDRPDEGDKPRKSR